MYKNIYQYSTAINMNNNGKIVHHAINLTVCFSWDACPGLTEAAINVSPFDPTLLIAASVVTHHQKRNLPRQGVSMAMEDNS